MVKVRGYIWESLLLCEMKPAAVPCRWGAPDKYLRYSAGRIRFFRGLENEGALLFGLQTVTSG